MLETEEGETEKSSLRSLNPIVSPITSHCTYTHADAGSCAGNALQGWSATTIWQREIFIQPGR